MKAVRRSVLLGLGLFLAAVRPAAAALSLDEAYQAALKRSETIAGQVEQIRQAEEQYRQAFGYLLPNINGAVSYSRQQALSSQASGAQFFPNSQTLVKISGNQPLFRGLRDFAALTVTSLQREQQQAAKAEAEVQLFQDLAAAYYQVLSFEQDRRNLEKEAGAYRKRIEDLTARVRIGRSKPSEVLTVQAALASLLAEAEQVRGQLAATREVLAFHTGLAADAPLAEPPPELAPLAPLPDYLARLEKRPDIKVRLAQQQVAEKNVAIAWGQHLPNADLSGNYYPHREGSFADVKWDFTAALSLPIFSGGVVSSQVRQAKSQRWQSELNTGQARRRAEEEIKSLHHQNEASREQEKALQSATKLAEDNCAVQQRDYRLGLVNNQDVLQALTTLSANERALDRARYNTRLLLLQLEAAAALQPRSTVEK